MTEQEFQRIERLIDEHLETLKVRILTEIRDALTPR